MTECAYEGCKLRSWEQDSCGLCILHSNEDKADEDVKKFFMRTLQAEIKRQEDDDKVAAIDFGSVVFPPGIEISHVFRKCISFAGGAFAGRVDFKGATFAGDVDFRGVSFRDHVAFAGVRFPGNIDFSDANFVETEFSNAAFRGDANFNGATFSGSASFGGAVFMKNADFTHARFTADASFDKAAFSSRATFQRAVFRGSATTFNGVAFQRSVDFVLAVFRGNARFDLAKFFADTDFRDAKFTANASFDKAGFSGCASFHSGLFTGSADFNGATFAGDANFSGATFTGSPSFARAAFSGKADFGDVNFASYVQFGGANFGTHALFTGAIFKDADFTGAKLPEDADFEGATFQAIRCLVGVRLRAVSFEDANVKEAILRDCLLDSCHLRGARGIEEARFENVDWGWAPKRLWRWKWPQLGLRLWTQRHNVLGDEIKARATGLPEDYAAAERVYHQLLKNYEDHRDFPEAEMFHYGEMEMRRLKRRFEPILTIYGALSGYGHAWFQSFCWLVAAVIAWSFLYGLSGLDGQTVIAPRGVSLTDIDWDATTRFLVYSMRSSILQPDRDLRPGTSWGQLAQVVQFVVGPLLIALTGLALRRKFRR